MPEKKRRLQHKSQPFVIFLSVGDNSSFLQQERRGVLKDLSVYLFDQLSTTTPFCSIIFAYRAFSPVEMMQ